MLHHRQSDSEAGMVVRVEAAEVDEMWSFVGSKQPQGWVGHAIDHQTGKGLADVLARKAICFSKTEKMHDTVIGLFINRHECGRAV